MANWPCYLPGFAMLLLAWLGPTRGAAADAASPETSGPSAPTAAATAFPSLEPIYRLKIVDGKQRFVTEGEVKSRKLEAQLDGTSFLAVCTNDWPAGLVPMFVVEKTNRLELRRRPQRGHESSAEPLFFALPPEDEPNATRLAGRWECDAVRGDNSKAFLAWELTLDGEQVAGRFDPNTEYRYAYLVGGTFRSNRIEFRVEYIMDAYLLTGEWQEGKLTGKWRRTDDYESGTWVASRGEVRAPSNNDIVSLYEWRRAADDSPCYALEGERLEPEWQRSPRPLCRVWRAAAKRPQ